ncbi:MAG: hypothetical protein WC358_03085 [Ignavibacteria bacterium]|jgi:hypothetical protein
MGTLIYKPKRDKKLEILKDKITKGVKLAHKRLVAERIKNDDYMIIYENGKVVRKKAREIYKRSKKS